MSTPTAKQVGESFQRAHAQQEWVQWLEGAEEHLDRIAKHFPATEDFSAGKVCLLRDMLKGLAEQEREMALLWENVANSDASARGADAYLKALDSGKSHDEAHRVGRQAERAAAAGREATS